MAIAPARYETSILFEDGVPVYFDTAKTLSISGSGTTLTIAATTVAVSGAISNTGLSVTVNSDPVAATDEDPSVVLKGGDGGTELIISTLKQDSSADLVYLSTGGGAAGTTRKTPTLVLGFPGETGADLDALLRFDAATTAAAARAATFGYYGQEHALEASSATAALKLSLVGTGTIGVNNAALDANQMSALSKTALSFGAGGASAVDWVLTRQAADIVEIASGDSLYSVAGNIGIRALSADAQPTAKLSGSSLSLGVGGATAVDWVLSRQAANVAELASGDSLLSVGTASIGRRATTADANPTIALTANGLELGVGGATATDIALSRNAANKLQLASGDTFMVGTLEETVANAGIVLTAGSEILGVSKVVSFATAHDTADVAAFTVPAGEEWIIEDMWHVAAVSWDGNNTAQVGDASDPDGYLVLANASMATTYDESSGITGWVTGSRGLDSANRGVYLSTAVTFVRRQRRLVGAASILWDVTIGTSTVGSGTLYMRYTRIS